MCIVRLVVSITIYTALSIYTVHSLQERNIVGKGVHFQRHFAVQYFPCVRVCVCVVRHENICTVSKLHRLSISELLLCRIGDGLLSFSCSNAPLRPTRALGSLLLLLLLLLLSFLLLNLACNLLLIFAKLLHREISRDCRNLPRRTVREPLTT